VEGKEGKKKFIFISRIDTLSDWLFRRGAPPTKILMGDIREAPRLNDQSSRVSILGVGINKDRSNRSDPIPGSDPDRSAKLWIIAEPE
jgi:hypothetical protein